MHSIPIIEGEHAGQELRIAIVAARFNSFVVDRLVNGALETLQRHGVAAQNIDLVRVPGAFELPVTAAKLLDVNRYDAIIALGSIIRGDTPHFDYVAGECARGLAQLAVNFAVPVIFGVLTTDTVEQALERAVEGVQVAQRSSTDGTKDTTKGGNKGAEAALCALEMANLLRKLAE